MPSISPYGSWTSPISPETLTEARPSRDFLSHSNGCLYWLESRPWENGRSVIVEKSVDGQLRDLLPAPHSVRSKVHEYGGTPYIVVSNTLYFCLQDDQQIYALDLNRPQSTPTPVTQKAGCRFADFCYDQSRHRLLCVCEEHSHTREEPENFIAAIPLDGTGTVNKLVSGADFYAYPRISPDQTKLCWIQWHHPNMPWDATELMLADLAPNGAAVNPSRIAGGEAESIFQPKWSPSGQLYFVSDRTDWWNLYRHNEETNTAEAVLEMDAEFATPLWVLGMSCYGFCDNGELIATCCHRGRWQLIRISADGESKALASDYSSFSSLCGGDGCSGNTKAYFIASSATTDAEIVSYNLAEQAFSVEQAGPELPFCEDYLSRPEAITFATSDREQAHGFYYPPTNPDFVASAEQKPSLLVICHGGPTGATSTSLNLKVQFWTSRGFAVLDVNYRGSTGYGRRYRQLLNDRWGLADVEDVVNGAQYIIDKGLADPEKIAIRGSSAGGYTVLAALTFHNLFKAGACLYGIGDLETLAADTHKFESRYLDHLVGPYPEQQARYRARSPIHHTDKLNCPIIFFQGLDDKVVPPAQANAMVEAMRAKQLPVAYLPFEGEGHGFRKAETICRALAAELYFYSRIFDFPLPDAHIPVEIENL